MEKKESEILIRPPRGPDGDPAPPYLTGLLTKGRIAEIVVHQYEMKINELRGQIALFELAQNLLIEEHGIDYKRLNK
jgi:hypothetical protein